MSDKTIYLIRHTEAEHNPKCQFDIHDPNLTPLGRKQAQQLYERTKDGLQDEVELIVTSPMKRTLQTTLEGLRDALGRLRRENTVILPYAQECNSYPCDVGSSAESLRAEPEFAGFVFTSLSRTPEWTSKKGFWSKDPSCLRARAKFVRRWLRDREEKTIVLVTHGAFIQYLLYGSRNKETTPANGEVKSVTFVSDDDEDAWMVQKEVVLQVGDVEPTSDSEDDD